MKKKGSIFVIDDNRNVLNSIKFLLSDYFEEVFLLDSPQNLLFKLRSKSPDVILLDMNFSAGINSGNEGLFWLQEIKQADPELPVVLFTAYADIDLAVKALKAGATDFVVKPWDNAKLLATLEAAKALRYSRKEVLKLREKQKTLNDDLQRETDICWGESSIMKQLLIIIRKIAVTDANVLITGENGTGKELIAKTIHRYSPRSTENMVCVDMGSVSETLFESELFGHVKGAFTDAKADRAGKFEAADNGTLFLDEIGNLSYSSQAKLLSVLQVRQITRVGSNHPTPINIRLISATNKNLIQSVQKGEFREDLLYRLNTIHLEVPPLRERREDIPLLSQFFLKKQAGKYDKYGMKLSEQALRKLEDYDWPGNVRELEHTIEKAVILSDNIVLQPKDFLLRAYDGATLNIESFSIEEMEKILIEKALKKYDGNRSTVANELGITRPTLYHKIKKYHL